MLRAVLIYLSKASWARRLITNWLFAWRVASRFVAGEDPEDAIAAIKTLNAAGINATLDHLGEHTNSIAKAHRSTEDILAMLEKIEESGLRANVSIKLTQIGLEIDRQVCAENLEKIVRRASELHNFIRIDMEDEGWVETTLELYFWLRNELGLENVGVVIQSYLYRSEADIRRLNEICAPVRLCKGAYKEPASVAYPRKADVDANYDRLVRALIENALEKECRTVSPDGRIPPVTALATHDERRIAYARELAGRVDFPQAALEFQMLYGIRRDLQQNLAQSGFPVRVYVPYGSEWYPYFVRRLAERPSNLWFFISNLFRS